MILNQKLIILLNLQNFLNLLIKNIYSNISQNENKSDDNENSKIFKNYSSPSYDDKPNLLGSELMINDQFLWILL